MYLFVALLSTIKTCREVCNYLVSIKYLKLDRTTNHFKNSSERYKNKNYKVILTWVVQPTLQNVSIVNAFDSVIYSFRKICNIQYGLY